MIKLISSVSLAVVFTASSPRIGMADRETLVEVKSESKFVEAPQENLKLTIDLVPQIAEFEGFILYGYPIQSTSTNALGQTITTVFTPTAKASQMIEIARQQRAHLQRYELQIEALEEALKALKTTNGSERHIAAIEQLSQLQKQEFQTAKTTYANTLATIRDIEVTAPKADSQSTK